MPPLDAEQDNLQHEAAGQPLATAAEALYLANLLVLPGIAFVILMFLFLRRAQTTSPLARCHLRQTVSASIWAGIMLLLVNGLIIVLGGYESSTTWIIVILYFTTVHASLVLLGTVGLAKAMAGRPFVFPLIGRPCPEFDK